MIVPRQIVKRIEHYFYNFESIVDSMKIEEEDIIFGTRAGEQEGGRSNEVSQVTEKRALKLIERQEKFKERISWIEIIKETIEHFANTEYEKFINMLYLNQFRQIKIMNDLAIEKTTYYKRKEDIITYAYCKAIEKGLVKV